MTIITGLCNGIILEMSAISSCKNWVYCQNPNPHTLLRLFCFPYVGGGSVIYRKWQENFPSIIEICTIRLPGRESRFEEPLFTNLSLLVKELFNGLLPFLDLPFAFFGHSMGSLLSFELARLLRKENIRGPISFFVSGSKAPHLPKLDLPCSKAPDKEFINKLNEFNGIPKELLQNYELLEIFLPVLRADIEMCNSYVYIEETPLKCPITSFGGVSDPKINQNDVAAWHQHTSDDFNLLMLPGDHFFLNSNLEYITRIISQELIKAKTAC